MIPTSRRPVPPRTALRIPLHAPGRGRALFSRGSVAAVARLILMVGGYAPAARAQAVRGSDPAPGDSAVVRWAAANALPIRSVEPGGDAADLRRLAPVVGAARVVALG